MSDLVCNVLSWSAVREIGNSITCAYPVEVADMVARRPWTEECRSYQDMYAHRRRTRAVA